jgi:hypothetical protein
MKRISHALEVRRPVDRILTGDPEAAIVVASDFNAEPDDVPVLAIRGRIQTTGPRLPHDARYPNKRTSAGGGG